MDFIDLERREQRSHPNTELIFVKNDSDDPYTWVANSIPVTIAPRTTTRIPRWAFHLGCKYPGAPLIEVSPKEGTLEYEKSLLIQRKTELDKAKQELAQRQAEVADAEKRLKVASAHVEDAVKKNEPPPKKEEDAKKEK